MIAAAARAAGDRPILAAPYPLSAIVCRKLAADGLIAGYVAEHAPDPPEPDPLIAGWWTDRTSGIWFLRPAASPTLLLLSAAADHELDGGLLLEASLKGVRRVLYVGADGSVVKEIDVVTALMRLLSSAAVANPVHQLNYDEMFAEIYTLIGDRLRLPPAAFVPGRILILIGSLGGGGAERQAAYTAAGLSRRFPGRVFVGRCYGGGAADSYKSIADAAGAQSCVISLDAPEYESDHIRAVRERLAQRYDGLAALGIFQMIFHHALLIRELRPDIVHTWLDYSNTLGGVAAELVGVPRLVMSGRSVAPDKFAFFQPYMAPAYRAVMARREVVLLNNSKAGAEDYARWLGLPVEGFRIIANGYEAPQPKRGSRPTLRAALGIPQAATVIGSVMRFREEKRPQLWLEMAVLLHRAYPDLRFVIFGDGDLLADCRALVETAGLSDVVSLPGETTEVWDALSAIDIFVLTSRVEGLPNVMIEAQLVGLPVVCTGAGGMYETFVEGETGFGVRAGGAEALAQTVGRLVDDPALCNRIKATAPQRALAAFGIERMIDETIDAYRSAKSRMAVPAPDWQEPSAQGVFRLGGILRHGADRFAADLPLDLDAAELSLWEDDYALEAIEGSNGASLAGGRYHVSGARVFFAPPDGSDPRFNGRTYWLRPRHFGFDEVVIDPDTMQAETGYCYTARLGPGRGGVRFALWEDRTRLGPGACLHDEIRLQGGGRHSLWGEYLYFSASDNSDPRTNRRSYVLRSEKGLGADEIEHPSGVGISMADALRNLLGNAAARPDFVPGRVVHVGGSLGPGGAERQIVYTLTGLLASPIESVQLLCSYIGVTASERYDFYLPTLAAAGVPVRRIRRRTGRVSPETLPRSLRAVYRALPPELIVDIADLYWEFIELRPEVVHAWLDGNLDRAGIAAALAGVPRIVLGARNMNPTHFAYWQPYMGPAYQALIDLPQVSMTNNSVAGRDDFGEWLGIDPNRITVIYNGIDFPEYRRPAGAGRARLRRKFSLDPSDFLIGGIFRFAEEKRPLLWLETAAEVARQLSDARFILFGRGELQQEMERQVMRRGLRGRLIFAGITTEVLDNIAMMDVLLLTSAFEGIPNVVLEAQWAGTAVVATRAGGMPEAMEHGVTGWIVDPPTPSALAARIVALHDNPAARTTAQQRGPGFVGQKFGVGRMINETLKLYRMSAAVRG
jgi:glycosyltransferase involved in cell wall biosynthesis